MQPYFLQNAPGEKPSKHTDARSDNKGTRTNDPMSVIPENEGVKCESILMENTSQCPTQSGDTLQEDRTQLGGAAINIDQNESPEKDRKPLPSSPRSPFRKTLSSIQCNDTEKPATHPPAVDQRVKYSKQVSSDGRTMRESYKSVSPVVLEPDHMHSVSPHAPACQEVVNPFAVKMRNLSHNTRRCHSLQPRLDSMQDAPQESSLNAPLLATNAARKPLIHCQGSRKVLSLKTRKRKLPVSPSKHDNHKPLKLDRLVSITQLNTDSYTYTSSHMHAHPHNI